MFLLLKQYTRTIDDRLKKIQNIFLKTNTFHCGVSSPVFKSLIKRQVEFGVTFTHKALNGVINVLDLLSKIPLAVPPYYSRNLQPFKTTFHFTNYEHANPSNHAYHTIYILLNIDLSYDFFVNRFFLLLFVIKYSFYIVRLIVLLSFFFFWFNVEINIIFKYYNLYYIYVLVTLIFK